jgi:polynucleotide kinase-phosphatase
MMLIKIPKLSLVVLIGPSGSGKTTFARRHFLATEVLSSDMCRAMVADDENDQTVTRHAFDILHHVAAKRLELGKLTVIDATNVQTESRKPLVELARKYHCLPAAIVFDIPEQICHERNRARTDRNFGPHVVRNQKSQLRRSMRSLRKEGFRYVFSIEQPEDAEVATVERTPLWNDRRDDHGPFDIIGDIHGCCDELEALMSMLGYQVVGIVNDGPPLECGAIYAHSEGRKAVFLGDLVDRGPRNLDVVRLVRNMVRHGSALCIPGNHDVKLVKKLRGRDVLVAHGFAQTLAEIGELRDDDRVPVSAGIADFLDGLVSHYVLDDGKLVVAHAGMKESMQGRASGRVRDFALYGETTGETDDLGLPVRLDWAREYRGRASVVYGHTPVPVPEWLNQTVNIDTGCVFGGKLTALRYPEREFVSVPAARVYSQPARPFIREDTPLLVTAQQANDDLLDAEDVLGKRMISTRLRGKVTIREENAAAALEVMSRFAVDPKWLIYLPPTMSPCETSDAPGLLEHPAEVFAYYRGQNAARVICQEKHMGSRAIVIICRDEASARARFGALAGEIGIIATRTGRRFLSDPALERSFLERVCLAMDRSGIWSSLETSWACLDCELMPWSAKAQELLRSQYAPVGAAGLAALPRVVSALHQSAAHLEGGEKERALSVEEAYRRREHDVGLYVDAYRRYCWSVYSLLDLKLAPFHLLATEGSVHTDKDHLWHMETLARLAEADPELLLPTSFLMVDLNDPASLAAGVTWWDELTARGGEGMVVKPLSFIHQGSRGLAQPALKCRGREYLRIIYGPEYTAPQNLARLRARGLGRKRSLALSEFALGIEALERFVRREPLRKVHECVFGVLALESEPVDPRL